MLSCRGALGRAGRGGPQFVGGPRRSCPALGGLREAAGFWPEKMHKTLLEPGPKKPKRAKENKPKTAWAVSIVVN